MTEKRHLKAVSDLFRFLVTGVHKCHFMQLKNYTMSLTCICTDIFFLPQGFPDFAPPSHVVEALGHVTSYANHMIHHYTRAAVC